MSSTVLRHLDLFLTINACLQPFSSTRNHFQPLPHIIDPLHAFSTKKAIHNCVDYQRHIFKHSYSHLTIFKRFFWAPGLNFEHHHVFWRVCNHFQTFSTVFNRLNLPAPVLNSGTRLITTVFERNHALSVHNTHFRWFLTVLEHFWPFTLVFDQYHLFSSTSTRFQTLPLVLDCGLDFWLVTPPPSPSRRRQRSTYLATKDIHSLTSTFGTNTRRTVLTAYFLAAAALKTREIDASPKQESALLAAALSKKASVFALFGGQGTNEVYFGELQNLYDIYKPFVAPFVQTITEEVLAPLVAEEEASTHYMFGLDVVSWLSGATVRPAVPYLASVPISFPLIGLTQLVQYLVVCHVANLTPGELRSRLSGATGHSQGIVSAVVIAASGTFEEFADNSHKAIKWLFYSSLRGQEAFPVTSMGPSIVQDAIVGGEGTPSPMLSIAGLTLKELQPHVSKTNRHLPANSQLHVSLHNGPKTFVITGPPKALFGLVVTSLRKIRAQSGLDQSKTPFSRLGSYSLEFHTTASTWTE